MMSGGEYGSRRRYTNEFKIEAVKLGKSVGHSEASRRLGIPDNWWDGWDSNPGPKP